MKYLPFLLLSLFSTFFISCNNDETTEVGTEVDMDRLFAGGETTIFSTTSLSYSSPASNLSETDIQNHTFGDHEFESVFVTAPATLNQGLGPYYNNSSCIKCHPSDGRGRLPTNPNSFSSLLLRISIDGVDENGGPLGVPNYGTQARNHAVPGFEPELLYNISWEYFTETLADGTVVNLRKPIFSVSNGIHPIPSNILVSPRIAPPVFGLGLLDAIPEASILALTDVSDANQDGISGKANYVWNPLTQQQELGRFGWKANTANLLIQAADAYFNDMGITSNIHPIDFPSDGLEDDPELSVEQLNLVTFYLKTLAVPAPRDVEKQEVINGYNIFKQINCVGCHTPRQQTGNSSVQAIANQTIYPFTDLLLHDMGDGLADNRPDFLATGKEWKTRPLWGIGLQQLVNGHTEFLHDGRARNMTEAILWHGGEALTAKNAFKNLSTKDRTDLLAFLNSL